MERTATSARAGAKDKHNHAVREDLPGLFQEMAGLKVKRFESLNNTKVGIRIGAIPAKGEVWADIVEPITAKPIAWYFDRKKHYSGAPAITEHPFGRGRVYYFGTSPGHLPPLPAHTEGRRPRAHIPRPGHRGGQAQGHGGGV